VKNHPILLPLTTAMISTLVLLSSAFGQGSLTPPGAPAPTMKTLDQLDAKLERRTAITNLPFTISAPGSYFLATNLSSSANGIIISASSVTLDLNGFELAGAAGSTIGVNVSGSRTNICVRNGTVRGWNGDGLNLSNAIAVIVNDLRVSRNAGNGMVLGTAASINTCVSVYNAVEGIVTGDAANIRGCVVYHNNVGILGGNGCQVRDTVTFSNFNYGIYLGVNGTVVDCTSSRDSGIFTGSGSLVSGCASLDSRIQGIVVGDGSIVRDCRSSGTRDSVSGDGIDTGLDCLVKDCITVSNALNGIFVFGRSRVIGCYSSLNGRAVPSAGIFVSVTGGASQIDGNQVCNNNGYGIYSISGGDLIVRNSASGNSTNYFPASGTSIGPVQSASNVTNAWGNLVY
jgi:hypothetical protein